MTTNMRNPTAPGIHWLLLALTVGLFLLVATLVDLKPVVDEHFFFSTRDAAFRQAEKVDRRFPSAPNLILTVSSRDISSAKYLQGIARLTTAVRAIDQVTSVKSLTTGPKSLEDAMQSPFWHRLLIADNGASSNLVVFVENKNTETLVRRLEHLVD